MSLWMKRLRWRQVTSSGRPAIFKVAILATFTAEPVVPFLGIALEEAGVQSEIRVGPYNQIIQECLGDVSETARFSPDLLVVWPRFEELWSGRRLPLVDDPDAYAEDIVEISETALEAARRWRATLLFVLPAIPEIRPLGIGDACSATGVSATASAVRETVRRRLAKQQGVLLLDLEEHVRRLGSMNAYNYRTLAVARIPFSDALLNLAGESIGRLARLTRASAAKALVVDADNTLWGGVVGEDSPERIDLGDSYQDFQLFLLELRRMGVLIALCTKNEETLVWQAFARPEMRLKKEHLVAWRIGWDNKSQYLREIADELGVGAESLVIIDDNVAELAEVGAALPEVARIRMPEDAAEWPLAIYGTHALDRLSPTADDMNRASYYLQEQRRLAEQRRAVSPADYLADLGLAVRVAAPAPGDFSRLAQLVAKTNQFNLNCKRRSLSELSEVSSDFRYLVRIANAKDRFGDYGTVGAVIVRMDGEAAEIDTFLLSCRAMGRSVEQAMLAAVFEELERRGCSILYAAIEERPRNEAARRFFKQLGCDQEGMRKQVARLDWPSYMARA